MRITVAAAGIVLAVLVVVAVLLVVTQRAALLDQLDESLEVDAERIAAGVAAGSEPPVLTDDDRLVAVVADGAVVAVTSELEPDQVGALAGADEGDVTIDGEGHRVARADAESVAVVVAGPTEDIDDAVAALVRALAVLVPTAGVLLAAIVWLLVGRALRPVERIRAEVAAIGLDELHRRVPQPDGTDEIARLAATMNEMLDRLDAANQRQQRFTADASHELRTPLTRMRAELELDQRHPGRADVAATRESLLDEVASLQRLIDDLLLLARGDAGVAARRGPVDLDDIVLEEARAAGSVDVGEVSAAQVSGDPAALRRVVRNLLDNARRHATTTVSARLSEVGGEARLIIDDDGPGIPLERRDEVFERFRRLDDARSPGDGRTGLGLAIVGSVVTQLGGTVAVSDSPWGGARLTVTLPLHRI